MNPPARKTVFMGSPEFAVASLEALVASQRYRPALVVSQPDRGRGRGRAVMPTAVRARARELGLDTDTMSKENYADVVARIGELAPEVIVVVAFGIIVKRDLLDMPPHGCVNVHASLLPSYRGVSPIQAAILAGEPETGVTTMRMDEGVDTGDVLLQRGTPISPDDTAGSLSERLAAIGAELLVETLDGLFDGTVTPAPQPETDTAYTKKIKKKHGEIRWEDDAPSVDRRVRAMTPWPSAYTFVRGKRLIVLRATPEPDDSAAADAAPGTIVALDPFKVACGSGALVIHRFKPEGKKAMPPAAFVAGHSLSVGDVLGG